MMSEIVHVLKALSGNRMSGVCGPLVPSISSSSHYQRRQVGGAGRDLPTRTRLPDVRLRRKRRSGYRAPAGRESRSAGHARNIVAALKPRSCAHYRTPTGESACARRAAYHHTPENSRLHRRGQRKWARRDQDGRIRLADEDVRARDTASAHARHRPQEGAIPRLLSDRRVAEFYQSRMLSENAPADSRWRGTVVARLFPWTSP